MKLIAIGGHVAAHEAESMAREEQLSRSTPPGGVAAPDGDLEAATQAACPRSCSRRTAAASLVVVPSTDWRNGSASDSSPEGYAFESRIGHYHSKTTAAHGTPTGTGHRNRRGPRAPRRRAALVPN